MGVWDYTSRQNKHRMDQTTISLRPKMLIGKWNFVFNPCRRRPCRPVHHPTLGSRCSGTPLLGAVCPFEHNAVVAFWRMWNECEMLNCIHIYIYIHTYVFIYIYAYICMYTHICITKKFGAMPWVFV